MWFKVYALKLPFTDHLPCNSLLRLFTNSSISNQFDLGIKNTTTYYHYLSWFWKSNGLYWEALGCSFSGSCSLIVAVYSGTGQSWVLLETSSLSCLVPGLGRHKQLWAGAAEALYLCDLSRMAASGSQVSYT